jgi:hypothetical protein
MGYGSTGIPAHLSAARTGLQTVISPFGSRA